MLKIVALHNIFVETDTFYWWIESSKEHHLFEICCVINVLTVNLLNDSIEYIPENNFFNAEVADKIIHFFTSSVCLLFKSTRL